MGAAVLTIMKSQALIKVNKPQNIFREAFRNENRKSLEINSQLVKLKELSIGRIIDFIDNRVF